MMVLMGILNSCARRLAVYLVVGNSGAQIDPAGRAWAFNFSRAPGRSDGRAASPTRLKGTIRTTAEGWKTSRPPPYSAPRTLPGRRPPRLCQGKPRARARAMRSFLADFAGLRSAWRKGSASAGDPEKADRGERFEIDRDKPEGAGPSPAPPRSRGRTFKAAAAYLGAHAAARGLRNPRDARARIRSNVQEAKKPGGEHEGAERHDQPFVQAEAEKPSPDDGPCFIFRAPAAEGPPMPLAVLAQAGARSAGRLSRSTTRWRWRRD